MPVYRYNCECGYEGSLFLKLDKSSTLLKCISCGRKIMARQIRDKSATFSSNNDVTGIFHNED